MSEERAVDVALLRKFSPFDGMKKENLVALARKVSITQVPANRVLFKEGDRDKRTYWLVSGLVELREGTNTVAMIRAGSPEARNPIAPKLPRKVTAAPSIRSSASRSTANCST
jgi:CRP-like cAMP-binding protein